MWLAAAATPLLVCAVVSGYRQAMENTNVALVLVLVIVGAAALGSRVAGLLAAFSSALWFDVLLTEPYGRLTITDRNDLETALLLIVVGAAVTEIALWGRRQQAAASRQHGYLDGILTAARHVGADPAVLIPYAESQLAAMLRLDSARFVTGGGPMTPELGRDGRVVDAGGREWDVEHAGLPTQGTIQLPVRNAGVRYGTFVLTAATHVARPTAEERRVAVLLADQVGAALAYAGAPGEIR